MKIVNNANFVFPFKITLLKIKTCANIIWINKSWRRLKITPNYIKLKMRNNSNKAKKSTEKIREHLDYFAKQKNSTSPDTTSMNMCTTLSITQLSLQLGELFLEKSHQAT